MHPGLPWSMGISSSGSVPQISNPTSTSDYSSSRIGSTMLTSSFMGTIQDNMTCFNMMK
jgi:hypothetical protein